MKKNISINISGIIFHIEEDGYEKLKEYLDSINKYFSTFEGSTEIIADIESRIAEIFLSKLNEGKQVITLEDVTALMATMGSIQDFQAVEEDTPAFAEPTETPEPEGPGPEPAGPQAAKKLYRDKRRRLLGGVAAGIAHYFAIDPLWIRLIFIALLFDFFVTSLVSSLAILAYIVLWIVTPASDNLEEDKKLKKMYRNPQGRVIGGVASGVATYFDIDVTIIRVLFVLSIFVGGSGIIAYIVLWMILPEARTITDKVQMKGEPVTLENIDSNIKESKEAIENPAEESTLVKVLLFPFRLIAMILTGLARALGPILRFLVEFIRIVAGVVLTLAGLALLLAVIVTGATFLGLSLGGSALHIGSFPFDLLNETVSPVAYVAAALVVGIPALGLMFLGLSIATKNRIPNATVGWTMFALWVIGVIGLSFTVPPLIYDFQTSADYTTTTYYDINAGKLVLDINEVGYEELQAVRVKLRGYDGDKIKLVQKFIARGPSSKAAIEQAKEIHYNVTLQDSVLTFDSNIDFSRVNRFRNQRMMITLYIPYGQKFIMRNNFDDIVYYSFGWQGYQASQIIGNTWMFNPTGLECLTCTDFTYTNDLRRRKYEELYKENLSQNPNDSVYQVEAFAEIKIDGPYEINIVRGEKYQLALSGPRKYIGKTRVTQSGSRLVIDYTNDKDFDIHQYNRKVKVKIITPHLNDVRLLSATSGDINGFEEDELYIRLDGAANVDFDGDIHSLEVKLSGASQLYLTGTGVNLTADVATASFLGAYSFIAKNIDLQASGAAKARVYATEKLTIDASLVSDVKYRGGAKVTKVKSSAFSNVQEEE